MTKSQGEIYLSYLFSHSNPSCTLWGGNKNPPNLTIAQVSLQLKQVCLPDSADDSLAYVPHLFQCAAPIPSRPIGKLVFLWRPTGILSLLLSHYTRLQPLWHRSVRRVFDKLGVASEERLVLIRVHCYRYQRHFLGATNRILGTPGNIKT